MQDHKSSDIFSKNCVRVGSSSTQKANHLCTAQRKAPQAQSAPSCGSTESASITVSAQPCIGAVILAADQGRAMGETVCQAIQQESNLGSDLRAKLMLTDLDLQNMAQAGYCKATMPLGDTSILGTVHEALASVLTGPILVVTGYHSDQVEKEAKGLGLATCHNPNPERGILSAIQTGLSALLAMEKEPSFTEQYGHKLDGIMLIHAAMPSIRPSTYALLLDDFTEHSAPITYPFFDEQRGYPRLIARHVAEKAAHYDGSLQTLFHDIGQDETRHVAVADEGILMGMKTSADYIQAVSRHAMRHVPSPLEREALFNLAGTPSHTRAHCRLVARTALIIAAHLDATAKGYISAFRLDAEQGHAQHDRQSREKENSLAYERLKSQAPLYDRPLIHAAGLLHDICKTSPQHEIVGKEFLTRYGFPQVGDLVARHYDVDVHNPTELSAAHIVMLADKCIGGEKLIPVEERFDAHIRQNPHRPDIVQVMLGRKERAIALRTAFEKTACVELYPLLQCKLQGFVC